MLEKKGKVRIQVDKHERKKGIKHDQAGKEGSLHDRKKKDQ